MRHSISADSVAIAIAIVVAVGNEEVGGVVPTLVSLLGRLTLNVSFAASAPTVEVTMMVNRTMLVNSAAAADDDDPGVIASALVVASSVAVALIWLEAIVDFVTSTVLLASSVGPRIPVDVS